ncbi:replicative DNA helicase [Acidithiobacillus sp. IBUN Pt1247-S3]
MMDMPSYFSEEIPLFFQEEGGEPLSLDRSLLYRQAERCLFSVLLVEPEQWEDARPYMAAEDFFEKRHRVLFDAMEALLNEGQPVDVLTVGEYLEREETLADIGGLTYLIEVAQEGMVLLPAVEYAKKVREYALLRALTETGREIAGLPESPAGRTAKDLVLVAGDRISALMDRQAVGMDDLKPVRDFLPDFIDEMEESSRRKETVTGLPTGFVELDEMTSGLHPEQLLVIAGRPAMGKTAFAMNIVEHVVCERKKGVAVFSMEMPVRELLLRHIASLGRIPQGRIRSGQLGQDDWPRIGTAVGLLNPAPLYLDTSSSLTIGEMRAKLRQVRRKMELSLVVVDYLQLMNAGARHRGNRVSEIAEISRGLKVLAKDLQVPVIALSQLNRGVESRTEKRPLLSDLRESGSIEQDADMIFLLYRDEVYNRDKEEVKGLAEVIVAKQRNGATGSVRLEFAGEYSRFSNGPGSNEEPYGGGGYVGF